MVTGGLPPSAAEILTTIKRLARERGVQPQALQTQFGVERFLYRLSRWEQTRPGAFAPPGVRIPEEPDGFTLKGAWCFVAWGGGLHRPTQDVDLQRLGDASETRLLTILGEMCAVDGADHVTFDPHLIEAAPIRQGQAYPGTRFTVRGTLGPRTRLTVRVDVVAGDVVWPPPRARQRLTTLIPGLPEPLLHVYSRESVVAEKLHAIATLGMINSRLNDYWDIFQLARDPRGFDAVTLTDAVSMTFERRDRQRPPQPDLPGLSDAYVATHRSGWRYDVPLHDVVRTLRVFLGPILSAAHEGGAPPGRWDWERLWEAPR